MTDRKTVGSRIAGGDRFPAFIEAVTTWIPELPFISAINSAKTLLESHLEQPNTQLKLLDFGSLRSWCVARFYRLAWWIFPSAASPRIEAIDEADMRFAQPRDIGLIKQLALTHCILDAAEENSMMGGK